MKEINEIPENIILNSLELLNNDEKLQLDKSLSESKKDTKTASEFNNLISLLPFAQTASGSSRTPSSDIKDKLFEKINKKITRHKTGFEFIYESPDQEGWMQHPVDGIKVKQLSVNQEKGYIVLLMKVAAGVRYPDHHHNGAEECYVISGDLLAEGKQLGSGDFHHAEGGSDHDELYTKNGCTLLLVVDPQDC